ncbi:MAG: response regulator [Chloroflexota bacterium]
MKILLVEDNELVRETLTDVLANLMGHEVTQAADGREAAALFLLDDYPVIISDIRMPNMTGLDFLEIINKSPKFPNTQLIFCTGMHDVEIAEEAIRNGASGFLLKPINIADLKDLLQKLTSKNKSRDSNNS